MSKKVIKYFFELVFIFLIPLLILVINCNYENTIEYDNNGNFQSTEKHIEFTAPFSYVKEPLYVNYLDFNQQFKYDLINNVQLSKSVQDNIITLEVIQVNAYSYMGIDIGTFDSNDKILLNINNYNTTNTDFYIAWNPNYHHFNSSIIITGQFSLFIDWRSCNVGDKLTFSLNIINLTQMYGSGYEPTIEEFNSLFPLDYYDYTLSEEVIIYDDNIISSNNRINYTIWGRLKNVFIEGFELQDNFVIDFIISYTILWFIMFIIWHIIYLLFDKLFHIRKE